MSIDYKLDRKWIIRECICGCGNVDLAQIGEHAALIGIERRHRPLVESLVEAANARPALLGRIAALEAEVADLHKLLDAAQEERCGHGDR